MTTPRQPSEQTPYPDTAQAQLDATPPRRVQDDSAPGLRALHDRVATALARHPARRDERARLRLAIDVLLEAGPPTARARLSPEPDLPDVVLHRLGARALRQLDLTSPAVSTVLRRAEQILTLPHGG